MDAGEEERKREMTESDWLSCSDPDRMLDWVRERTGKLQRELSGWRKFRLFHVACCHRVLHLLTDDRSRLAVQTADWHADGWSDDEELRVAAEDALAVARGLGVEGEDPAMHAAWAAASIPSDWAFGSTPRRAVDAVWYAAGKDDRAALAEEAYQAAVLRDIVGNPFRADPNPHGLSWRDLFQGKPLFRTHVDPSWRTEATRAVAHGIYCDRAFDRLPELAEALAAVGCDDADILGHCRASGPHVRGCWIVDLILGRE